MTFRRTLAALLAIPFLAFPAPARAAGGWGWPVDGAVITPFRNGTDPYAGAQHRGIDIAARAGTPVRAATAGTVRFAGLAGSSGLTVSIRTADGAFDTSYLHLGAADVREGAHVRAGERVGAVGTSGRRSAPQPHLHFGVRTAGTRHAYRNPLDFLAPAPRPGPRGAPAPVRVPVLARPLRAPVPRGRRVPERRPVRVPARPRVRVPAGRRLPLPEGGRAPLPVGRRVPVPVSAPAPVGRRAPLPRLGPAGAPVAVPRASPGAAPAHEPASGHAGAGGPDVGWALACLGLLLAAACLGRPGPGERPRRARGRAAVRAALRPLTGR
jgi:hypothetical protein